jgi:hypothetical protein
MYTFLLVVGLIAFILWLVGVIAGVLPAQLVSACLVIWIICLVVLLVTGFAVRRPHFWGRWW